LLNYDNLPFLRCHETWISELLGASVGVHFLSCASFYPWFFSDARDEPYALGQFQDQDDGGLSSWVLPVVHFVLVRVTRAVSPDDLSVWISSKCRFCFLPICMVFFFLSKFSLCPLFFSVHSFFQLLGLPPYPTCCLQPPLAGFFPFLLVVCVIHGCTILREGCQPVNLVLLVFAPVTTSSPFPSSALYVVRKVGFPIHYHLTRLERPLLSRSSSPITLPIHEPKLHSTNEDPFGDLFLF